MKISENRSKLAALAAATLVASAFALVVGAFTTQQAVAQTPTSSHQFAVGGFAPADTDMDGITHVAFAAQIVPTKTGYAGYVVQETATGSRSGPVVCMSESSTTQATVEWKVKNTNISGDVVGETRSFEVIDNGEPMMGVSQDAFKDRGTDANCNTDPMTGTFEPLLRGNIVVSP